MPRNSSKEHAAASAERPRGGVRPPRLSGSAKVFFFSLALCGVAATLYFLYVRHLDAAPRSLFPWWVLAGMFFLAEVLVVHVQFRRNAYSFSMSEIPLVLGLFAASPNELLLAAVTGSAIALIVHRRQSFLKLTFNLSHFALEAMLALTLFNALGPNSPLTPSAWLEVFLVTMTTAFSADLAVEIAVALAEGRMQLQSLTQRLAFGKVVSATNSSIALISVMILWMKPQAAWLLGVPAAILFFAYRIYTSQREQHERMEFLYQSTHVLNRSLKVEASVRTLLAQVREMFRSEIAEIVLLAGREGDPAIRTRLGPGDEERPMETITLDPTEGVWARVTAERQAVLLARPIQNERLRDHFSERGVRDAMVAPLRGVDGVVGTIMVANRMGDVSTFDAADLKLFEALANHASVSLENARLVQRLEENLIHLTEMNRMKDDFVATVSHELRTPLTSIQGSVKTLLQPGVEFAASDQHALLEVVDRQGERLRQLIEDLLVAARIESQQIQAVVTRVAISGLVKQVLEGLAGKAASHRVEFDTSRDPGAVLTDERRVYQIATNLIENALKYSPPGSTVTVRVRPATNGVELAVEDQGPGIPQDAQEKIFERFYQVDQTSTRAVGGTGLGLYICRRLAEVIGGRIALERSDERGSVFTLWIPREPPSNAVPEAAAPTSQGVQVLAPLSEIA